MSSCKWEKALRLQGSRVGQGAQEGAWPAGTQPPSSDPTRKIRVWKLYIKRPRSWSRE